MTILCNLMYILTDLAVGSYGSGTITILHSRPVYDVEARLTIRPSDFIDLLEHNCHASRKTCVAVAVELTSDQPLGKIAVPMHRRFLF